MCPEAVSQAQDQYQHAGGKGQTQHRNAAQQPPGGAITECVQVTRLIGGQQRERAVIQVPNQCIPRNVGAALCNRVGGAVAAAPDPFQDRRRQCGEVRIIGGDADQRNLKLAGLADARQILAADEAREEHHRIGRAGAVGLGDPPRGDHSEAERSLHDVLGGLGLIWRASARHETAKLADQCRGRGRCEHIGVPIEQSRINFPAIGADDPHQIYMERAQSLARDIGADELRVERCHVAHRIVPLGVVTISDPELMRIGHEGLVQLGRFLQCVADLDALEAAGQHRAGQGNRQRQREQAEAAQ